MTFSDSRIIELINSNFVAVWESAAPVKTATFDLGDGRSVKGTVGGEIALFFCRPDGAVFDILPALQSPAVTRQAIEDALAFYEETGATVDATRGHHRRQLQLALAADLAPGAMPHKKTLADRSRPGTPGGSRALAEMSMSKTGMVTPDESVIVIEPGGLDLYSNPIRRAFTDALTLVPPAKWKEFVFEEVLGQKLEGGDYRFNSMRVAPFSMSE